uniref:Zinc finger protein n=1 Tax=Siphoviridae sp. cthHz3 TaxID=2825614 RepID=A0A8S5UYH3_9CAUD|nr:MAG TPA: zinc finger protein [Siphoviridae sp. cthHz3]
MSSVIKLLTVIIFQEASRCNGQMNRSVTLGSSPLHSSWRCKLCQV